MTVQILKLLLSEVSYTKTETNYVLVYTDKTCETFPEQLKNLSPNFFALWKHFKQTYLTSDLVGILKHLELATPDIQFLVAFIIDQEQMLNYSRFFEMLDMYKDKEINLYIDHFDLEKHLVNYELFEDEIFKKFKNSKLNIIILNRFG